MRLIFLDFDGVLNECGDLIAAGTADVLSREKIARLNHVLWSVPDARIVVSSTWRLFPYTDTVEKLEERLTRDGLVSGRVIGMTPCLQCGMSDYRSRRGQEIAEWLASYSGRDPIESWVVVDDDLDMASLDGLRIVHTSYDIHGLTDWHADEMIRILRTDLTEE